MVDVGNAEGSPHYDEKVYVADTRSAGRARVRKTHVADLIWIFTIHMQESSRILLVNHDSY